MILPIDPAAAAAESVCMRIAEIDPWKRLQIPGSDLLKNLRTDPHRQMIAWQENPTAPVGGAAIIRLRASAELLFSFGFGPLLARHHQLNWPCHWHAIPDFGYIGSLAVLDNQTRRGIGQALIDAAHEIFSIHGHTRSVLLVSEFNQNARRFYERNGYRLVGHVDDCLRPGNRENLYERDLQP